MPDRQNDVNNGLTTTIPPPIPDKPENNENPQCVICLSRQAITANIPCGHRIYCVTCCHNLHKTLQSNTQLQCSTCLKSLTSIIKLY